MFFVSLYSAVTICKVSDVGIIELKFGYFKNENRLNITYALKYPLIFCLT